MTETETETEEPRLKPICTGWAAHGDGWAVHGATREEAMENFRKAQERHRIIDVLPPFYLQKRKPAR